MSRTRNEIYANPVFLALNPQGRGKEFMEFLDVRWLPLELNPYLGHGIKMGAVVLKRFPHIKTVATVQMMLEDFGNGLYDGKHTIVVPSSGNTAHAVARLARAFGFSQVKVVLSADVPSSKKEVLAALSVDLIVVGGGKSVEERAKEIAKQDGHVLLDQYTHMGNTRAHYHFTGPEMRRVLGNGIAIVAIAMGSGGTAAGVGQFFHEDHPKTVVLGVRPCLGERVPGARDKERMRIVSLPWEKYVDAVVEVGTRQESFLKMRELWRAVEPQPGPSSGLAYGGLLHYLEGLGQKGLKKLQGKSVAFLCPDSGTLYSGLVSATLDTGQGLPIQI